MSYLNMNARITIGDIAKGKAIVVKAISEFDIEESVSETSDKATITLARNYELLAGKPILEYIRSGMPVKIECGYNGDLQTEFTGFIQPNGIDASYPIVLRCDELQDFRQNNWKESWRDISLKSLLQKIAPGYTIECADVQLGKLQLNNVSTYQVLEELKKNWGFFSNIHDKILHVGFSYDFSSSYTKRHDYILGKNVRDNSKLKFTTEDDYNVQVKVIVHQPDGKKLEIKAGSKEADASVKTYDAGPMGKAAAEQIATAQLKKVLYSGFKGSIEGFGTPRTHAGDSIRIINQVQPEQNGTYLVEKVKISYKDAEIRRENFISYKVAD